MTSCWLNGLFHHGDAPLLSPTDRGFTLGDGIYESIRLRDGRVCWLERHWARLETGAACLRIPLSMTLLDLASAIDRLVITDDLRDGAVRVTLSRGPGPRGLPPPPCPTPTLLITAGPVQTQSHPIALITSQQTRRNEHSPLSRVKSLNTLDSILARMEAADQNAEDALLLNTAGRVAEATSANLFIQQGDRLITPPLTDGALPGVARAVLMERCGAVERALHLEEILAASAVFLSNSAGLRPVARLDEQRLALNPDAMVRWNTVVASG